MATVTMVVSRAARKRAEEREMTMSVVSRDVRPASGDGDSTGRSSALSPPLGGEWGPSESSSRWSDGALDAGVEDESTAGTGFGRAALSVRMVSAREVVSLDGREGSPYFSEGGGGGAMVGSRIGECGVRGKRPWGSSRAFGRPLSAQNGACLQKQVHETWYSDRRGQILEFSAVGCRRGARKKMSSRARERQSRALPRSEGLVCRMASM